jgi:hypothetical protein
MFGYLGSYLFDREPSKWYLGNCFMFVYGLVEQRPRQKFKTTNKQKTECKQILANGTFSEANLLRI